MSYEEQVWTHPMWSALDGLAALVADAITNVEDGSDARATLHRAARVLEQLDLVLKSAEPALVPIDALDSLAKRFAAIASLVNKFQADRNVAGLGAARAHVDQAIRDVAAVCITQTSKDVEGIADAVTSFRQSVGQHRRRETEQLEASIARVDELRKTQDHLAAEIKAMQAALDVQKTRVDEFINNAQAQTTSSEQARTKNFQDTLNSLSQNFREQQAALEAEFKGIVDKRAETAVAHLQAANANLEAQMRAIQDAEDQRSDRFDHVLAELDAERQEHEDAVEERFDALDAAVQQELAVVLQKNEDAVAVIRSHAEEAGKIVELIASSSMSDEYSKVAQREGLNALVWRIVTALLLVGLVVFVLCTFTSLSNSNGGFAWAPVLSRMAVTLAFIVAATYAGRQSASHREAELRARRLHLEFTALEPYLSSLPPNDKNMVKRDLAMRMFGNETASKVDPWEGVTPAGMMRDLVKSLGQFGK